MEEVKADILRKKRKKAIEEQTEALNRAEVRALLRAEESRLSMKLQKNAVALGKATSIALRDGHTNGNTAEAIKEADEALKEYVEFVEHIAAQQIAKCD